MSRIRELSANEKARQLAFERERALHDDVSFLNEARREGRQEGRQQGIERTLRKLITLKFGEIPESASKRLEQATDEQLDAWVEQILSANSLDDLFTTR